MTLFFLSITVQFHAVTTFRGGDRWWKNWATADTDNWQLKTKNWQTTSYNQEPSATSVPIATPHHLQSALDNQQQTTTTGGYNQQPTPISVERFAIFKYFGHHIEILWKKYSLSTFSCAVVSWRYGCIRSTVGWGCIPLPPPCWHGEGRICCTWIHQLKRQFSRYV